MELIQISLSQIKGSVYQPRSQPDLEIQNLVKSILKNGLINPLVVKEDGENASTSKDRGKYKILCGNRRTEALRIIEKTYHPVSLPEGAASIDNDGKIVVDCVVFPSSVSKEDCSINTLVENIERLDLTPLERGRCYKELQELFQTSETKLAERLNKAQSEITRYINLLSFLHKNVQDALDKKLISYKHALIIMRIENKNMQLKLLQKIIDEQLKLPDTEFWCDRILEEETPPTEKHPFEQLESDFMKNKTIDSWIKDRRLRMVKSRRGERIILDVQSREELIEMIELIKTQLEKWRK